MLAHDWVAITIQINYNNNVPILQKVAAWNNLLDPVMYLKLGILTRRSPTLPATLKNQGPTNQNHLKWKEIA